MKPNPEHEQLEFPFPELQNHKDPVRRLAAHIGRMEAALFKSRNSHRSPQEHSLQNTTEYPTN